jgi:hypothetical protein
MKNADTVEFSPAALAASESSQPGRITRAIGCLADLASSFLVAWGEWLDGTSPEEVERRGG